MKMWFATNMAWKLLQRRRGPVLRMVLTSFLTALWVVGGIIWALAAWRDVVRQTVDVRIDVVMASTASDSITIATLKAIRKIEAVQQAYIVDDEAVWEEFATDLGLADDAAKSLAALPSIIRVALKYNNTSKHGAESFEFLLLNLPQADNVDVVATPDVTLVRLDERRYHLIIVSLLAGILTLAVVSTAIGYALRAELHRAEEDFPVVSLLGASSWQSIRPHMLVGMFCGALGLAGATGVIVGTRQSALQVWPWLESVTVYEIALALGGLAVFGAIVTIVQGLTTVRTSTAIRKADRAAR
ncbi:MAG TPA: hypothetical protein DIS79_10960 [Bacteroidetes bacterium]|nr:hypothetical protein [Bacteroidota bacterium]HRK03561.1 hypothetical protein [Chlorobiota bacterium]